MKAPSEIAVTSAPVLSLNDISRFSSLSKQINDSSFELTTPRKVSAVSSLVVAVFDKYWALKWPLRLHLKQVAFLSGQLSLGLWSLPHHLHGFLLLPEPLCLGVVSPAFLT